jgi:hypothetical protein
VALTTHPHLALRLRTGTCTLRDTAVSGGSNVIEKEAENSLEYQDLTTETHFMCSVKTKVIPVITGTIATISKSFRKYLSHILGKHKTKTLQKAAILGTAHTLR